jgi:hypothetical protein
MMIFQTFPALSSSQVQEWSEEGVRHKSLILRESELYRGNVDLEQESGVYLVDVFWLLIRYFARKQISKGEVSVHYRV